MNIDSILKLNLINIVNKHYRRTNNMDFVAIDLGASNTRYVSNDKKINILPNDTVFFDDMSEENLCEPSNDGDEYNLDVSIWKEGESTHFPRRFTMGDMTYRRGGDVKIPSQQNKTRQTINYCSTVLAVAMSKRKNENIGDKVNVFIALPPLEVANSETRNKFINELKGNYTVCFNKIGKTGTTIQFEICNVACYAESRLALMQFLFDENHPERLEKYSAYNILSLDIGASTTDAVIFKEGRYIDRSGYTIKHGGNDVRDEVMLRLLDIEGRPITVEEANRAVIEGVFKRSRTYENIGDVVDGAKKKIAALLITEITKYFSSAGFPLDTIDCIVVSGGGSMGSYFVGEDGKPAKNSAPISQFITQELMKTCPSIEVIYFDDEPRLANINGLATFAILSDGEIDN